MKLDPLTLSITALAISILSLLISLYRAGVDRRIQLEQLRGEMRTRLTSWAVDVLSMIEGLKNYPSPETVRTMEKLLDLAKATTDIRHGIQHLSVPICIPASLFAVEYHRLKNDTEDLEPLFNALSKEMEQSNFTKVNDIADGIIYRLVDRKKNR
ncbi:MAG: hypothetical protein KKG09_03165 [Verrucomicrobia bacterium]|nr:hypothetical protein [Verrucomicrobiota bacterium]MCG2681380.1 hypothetical protein [Kiritimatiellia bacterium]MBU4248165.1 hypothetical protein [Verrucomicrobiota bacterium]MBU4291796.1 hypothetical protein [Verrucomicrobiota bacterium]MBU4430286.1 hypothetical protein [Verrucomicrobiota bacterium]